jgi:FAD:protein FMN transferase
VNKNLNGMGTCNRFTASINGMKRTIDLFYPKHFVWVAIWYFIPCNIHLGQDAAPAEFQQLPERQSRLEEKFQGYECTFPAMGTLVHLTAYSDDAETVDIAFRAAEQEVRRLESILTDYDSSSEARRLPAAAAQQPTEVSGPLWDVLEVADYWYRHSQGSLDCSLGALTHLWRKHRRANRIPEIEAVQNALNDGGWQNVQLDRNSRSVTMAHDRIRLDFGAIGKGYVIDRVFELLWQRGLHCTLVNISGDMRCGRAPPGKESWRIAIAPLQRGGETLRKLGVKDCSIATSGDLWQFQMIDGQKRSHIIDPRTGLGTPGPVSVTVIAPSACEADALATIGCILDWRQFEEIVESREQSQALLATEADGMVVTRQTSGFPNQLHPVIETREKSE